MQNLRNRIRNYLIDLIISRSLNPHLTADTIQLLIVIIDHKLILDARINQATDAQGKIIRFYDIIGDVGWWCNGVDDCCLFI